MATKSRLSAIRPNTILPQKRNPFSWEGLEDKRKKLRELAYNLVHLQSISDKAAEILGLSLTGVVCAAIKDPTSTSCQEAIDAANAHLELSKFQQSLVWEDGLDFDFVRREYATILDPSYKEADLCERNIKLARTKY